MNKAPSRTCMGSIEKLPPLCNYATLALYSPLVLSFTTRWRHSLRSPPQERDETDWFPILARKPLGFLTSNFFGVSHLPALPDIGCPPVAQTPQEVPMLLRYPLEPPTGFTLKDQRIQNPLNTTCSYHNTPLLNAVLLGKRKPRYSGALKERDCTLFLTGRNNVGAHC